LINSQIAETKKMTSIYEDEDMLISAFILSFLFVSFIYLGLIYYFNSRNMDENNLELQKKHDFRKFG
jgi:hypothetical protein